MIRFPQNDRKADFKGRPPGGATGTWLPKRVGGMRISHAEYERDRAQGRALPPDAAGFVRVI